MSTKKKLDAIDAEISALDNKIQLQNQKLELLQQARTVVLNADGSSASELDVNLPRNAKKKEKQRGDTTSSSSPSPRATAADTLGDKPVSSSKKSTKLSSADVQGNKNRKKSGTSNTGGGGSEVKVKKAEPRMNVDDVYVHNIEIKNDYAMNSMGLLTVRSSRVNSKGKKSGMESQNLITSIDQFGQLHIHSMKTGHELDVIDLEHNTPVAATAYDGSDFGKAYYVSTGTDGSVHVTCIEVKRSNIFHKGMGDSDQIAGDGTVVTSTICKKFVIPQPTKIEEDDDEVETIYGSSVHMVYKGSTGLKGRSLFIGDNVGNLHQMKSADGEIVSTVDINPDGLPISKIAYSTRNVLMVASGSVLEMVGTQSNMRKYSYNCEGPKEDIIDVAVDGRTPHMVYAKLSGGATVVFHTKSKESREVQSFQPLAFLSGKKKRDFNTCKIYRVIPPHDDKRVKSAGNVAVTKRNLLIAGHDKLDVYASQYNARSKAGLDYLSSDIFDDDVNKFHFPSLPFGVTGSNFDKGFEGMRVQTGQTLKVKEKHGLLGMLGGKKKKNMNDDEAPFIVGFNEKRPNFEHSDAKSSIYVYNFLPPEKDDKSDVNWFESLGKGPMILAVLAGLYMIKGKFDRKKGKGARGETRNRPGIFNSIGGRGKRNKSKDRSHRVGALNSSTPLDGVSGSNDNFVDIDDLSSHVNGHVGDLGSAIDEE